MRRALALAGLCLLGCSGVIQSIRESEEGLIVNQAAFDNPECPKEQIKVLRVSPDWLNAEVEACGSRSQYHNMKAPGADGNANWVRMASVK